MSILYDRSRVVTDWKCPRARFLNYEYNGRGVVAGEIQLELYMGSAVHDGLAAIAMQYQTGGTVDIDLIAETAQRQMFQALISGTENEVDAFNYANEQAALVEGMLRGFYKQVWPFIINAYPVILYVEKEMIYEHDGLTFMSKPDLVVANHDGDIFYIEYKTTSTKKEEWVNSWSTAVQLHSTIRAIEQTTGDKVTGVVVQGLFKGFQNYGKQSSPFCYSYQRKGNPPFSHDEVSYEYKSGYKHYATWEMAGGVRAWVEGMPEDILASQFPQAPQIFIKDEMIDSFFKQRAEREHEIHEAVKLYNSFEDLQSKQYVLNSHFQQKFDQCIPAFGRACVYRKICHGHVDDPLTQGYSYRQAHHEAEAEQDAEG